VTIRPAKPADIPQIVAIEQDANTAAHWPQADYENMLASRGAKRVVLVAEERKQVLGFIVAQAATVEWEIENVVVARGSRRRRLATRLIERLLDLATANRAISVILEVRESNSPARALYRNAQFAETGRRSQYYSNPDEDAIVYRLDVQ
jgi:ribosomal-protein-alanine N-acetyltransferase